MPESNTNVKPKETIFWSKAKKLRIGNFKEEQRYPDGKIKSREMPLAFDEHVKICDNDTEKGKEEIAFIRKSGTLANGDCREVVDLAEAKLLTAQQEKLKGIRHSVVESVESTELREVGDGYIPMPEKTVNTDNISIKG